MFPLVKALVTRQEKVPIYEILQWSRSACCLIAHPAEPTCSMNSHVNR